MQWPTVGGFAGSSPLTRGKRPSTRLQNHVHGLIPAHAGKTGGCCARRRYSGAHPRSRGENRTLVRLSSSRVGSSPLTRGKPIDLSGARSGLRLIPAHAGKTWRYVTGADNLWAHPRSRGENEMTNVYLGTAGGSSPLTRGKRAGCAAGSAASGLIPAHAGKTSCLTRRSNPCRAHPRSRGENPRPTLSCKRAGGSSPLTRGKRASDRRKCREVRLIPAHAGKTRTDLRG